MDWHHLIYKTYVCLLQPFPLYSLIRVAYFLYGALVVTLRTCYGALQIVVLLLLLLTNHTLSYKLNSYVSCQQQFKEVNWRCILNLLVS